MVLILARKTVAGGCDKLRAMRRLLRIGCALLASGCATLVTGTNDTVHLSSHPSGADAHEFRIYPDDGEPDS